MALILIIVMIVVPIVEWVYFKAWFVSNQETIVKQLQRIGDQLEQLNKNTD